jgi:GT2 family glycosyltransferase
MDFRCQPFFSVIIPTYRRHSSLLDCLCCLDHYFEEPHYSFLGTKLEVIVSDDDFDPVFSGKLLNLFPWCKHIKGPSRGPASNRNFGAFIASGTWLLFTDDDCLPQLGWIEGFQIYTDDYDVLEGRTSSCGDRVRVDTECPVNETGGLLWSCNFAIRRSIFIEMSGFNEKFPAPAMEDVELNTRVYKAGLRRLFVVNAVVHHPWRIQKSLGFVNAHARSVACYVGIHPERASSFAFLPRLISLLYAIKNAIRDSFSLFVFAGLPRRLFLEFAGHFLSWFYVYRMTKSGVILESSTHQ